MPRLFTALEIPKDVCEVLSLKQGGLKGARWIDAESFHLTLRFIGDVETLTGDEITRELGRYALTAPFRVRLTHLGVFGGSSPRSLHVGAELSVELSRLQASQERLLQRAGCKPDGRKYVPHVTLARLHNVGATQMAEYIEQTSRFDALEFEINGFALFSARDSIGGGPYVVEQRFSFED